MWEGAWSLQQVLDALVIDDIDFSAVDFLRCKWDEPRTAMILTLRSWDGTNKMCVLLQLAILSICKWEPNLTSPSFRINFTIRNLPVGQYGVYTGNKLSTVEVVLISELLFPCSLRWLEMRQM
jgi:hypothetical protein